MDTFRLEQLVDIVKRAGDIIRNVHNVADIKEKEGPANFVTRYDSAVQEFLVQEFSQALPSAHFLAEEDGLTATDPYDGYVFVIDPIDGTTNFICDFHCSGICAGLALNGEMIMGAVYNPFREEMFYAEKGRGAFLNGRHLQIKNLPIEKGVTDCGACAPYPSLRDFSLAICRDLSFHTMDIRELGSAAIALCYVACGRLILYASPKLCAWDYAAAQIIIEEAGGVVCGYYGEPLDLRTGVTVLASTPKGKDEFLALTKHTREHYRSPGFLVKNF